MSDAEKIKLNKQRNDVKPNADQGKHNEPSPSAPPESSGSATVQDDNERKMLEALFQINRARICQQMWRNFNS